MALFFDKEWFDARLKAVQLTQADLAAALGLTPGQIAEIWKDQRELSIREVSLLAGLLGVPSAEIANRAGVATPVPRSAEDPAQVLRALGERVDRIERLLDDIMTALGKAKP